MLLFSYHNVLNGACMKATNQNTEYHGAGQKVSENEKNVAKVSQLFLENI